MKKYFILTILVLWLCNKSYSEVLKPKENDKSFDLQSVKCGMTMEDIKILFDVRLYEGSFKDSYKIYNVKVLNEVSYLEIKFNQKRVIRVIYNFTPSEKDPLKKVFLYNSIEQLLLKTYGKVELDNSEWKDGSVLTSVSDIAEALSENEVRLFKTWQTSDYITIYHVLHKNNEHLFWQPYHHFVDITCPRSSQ